MGLCSGVCSPLFWLLICFFRYDPPTHSVAGCSWSYPNLSFPTGPSALLNHTFPFVSYLHWFITCSGVVSPVPFPATYKQQSIRHSLHRRDHSDQYDWHKPFLLGAYLRSSIFPGFYSTQVHFFTQAASAGPAPLPFPACVLHSGFLMLTKKKQVLQ